MILSTVGSLCLAEETVVRRDSYLLKADLAAGRIEITTTDGAPLLGFGRLFSIDFHDGTTVWPGDMKSTVRGEDSLSATYTHQRANLSFSIVPERDRVVFKGWVECKQGVITRVALPKSFRLERRPRTRFLWPRVLGIELNESYLASERRMSVRYPSAFSDFCGAELGGVSVHFYRCQREEHTEISLLTIEGGDPPVFWRSTLPYIREGERWRIPDFACQIGGDLREAVLRYKKECGLGKPLDEKMTPEFFARWARMAEARVPEPGLGGETILAETTKPIVAYITNWMFGGFNRKFPDLLPPNASYGGEPGLREFIALAHKHGHLVRPYVNFTWFSEGWEGRDRLPSPTSEPSPSLVRLGDAALSFDLSGERIIEKYHGTFGYTACPGHPFMVERARKTRDALLDEYGVDFLYQDQLGARRWIRDLNPALPHPTDWGAALMDIGREAAERCPVATEFGNDRALEFAVTLNYWALPPMSPVINITGEARPPFTETQGRAFPYLLYLSSGDAVPQVKECLDPAWLSWAMLLGGRVTLGNLTLAIREGPDRETIEFLQQLADALGGRAVGDQLLAFDYLAPRVARSTWERHTVIANFSDEALTLEDGARIAPGGFDLHASDGLRAGRYVGTTGDSVLALIEPGAQTATTLAADRFDVQVGNRRLLASTPFAPRKLEGRRAAIIDFGADIDTVKRGGLNADDLARAFSGLEPTRVTTVEEFEEELSRCRILINAQSELLGVRQFDDWPAAVSRLREWRQAGGVWVELGRWPAWAVIWPDPQSGDWQRRAIGKAGFENLYGERCWLSRRPRNLPQAHPLSVTETGRAIFSPNTVEALASQSAIVTIPPKDFPDFISLCDNRNGPYIMVHPAGHGAIVRLGGAPIAAAPQALAETVTALLDGKLRGGRPVWRVPALRQIEMTVMDPGATRSKD